MSPCPEISEKRLFRKPKRGNQYQLDSLPRMMLQLADRSIRDDAIGREDNGVGFFPVCYLTRELVPDSHVLATRFAFRAWRNFDENRLDVFRKYAKNRRCIHERPI